MGSRPPRACLSNIPSSSRRQGPSLIAHGRTEHRLAPFSFNLLLRNAAPSLTIHGTTIAGAGGYRTAIATPKLWKKYAEVCAQQDICLYFEVSFSPTTAAPAAPKAGKAAEEPAETNAVQNPHLSAEEAILNVDTAALIRDAYSQTTPAIRIGVGSKATNLLAPLGFDKTALSYGSANGYSFHCSRRRVCGPPFGSNDVISVLVTFDKERRFISFYLNGVFANKLVLPMPRDVLLLPAVSLYGPVQAYMNFGPFYGYLDAVKAHSGLHPPAS